MGNPFDKGGKDPTAAQAEAARQAAAAAAAQPANVASQLFEESKPLRTATLGTLKDLLAGGPAEAIAPLAPSLDAINAQYGVARRNIIEGTSARGGGLASELAKLEANRAESIANFEGARRAEGFRQALTVGTQLPATAITGLGLTSADLARVSGQAQQAEQFGVATQTQRQQASGQALGTKAALGLLAAKA